MHVYQPGDLVVYIRSIPTSTHVEIGVVKSVTATGAFVAYHLGDTCSKTPFEHLRPIENAYAFKGLLTRSQQLGATYDDISEDCEDWSELNG